MNKLRVFASTTAAMLGGALLSPETVFAQSPSVDEESRIIAEVTVTARRRQESLQRVPEQITVFTSSDIVNAQITSYQDFANLTPNFQSFENFRKGVFNITVRGIPTVQGGEVPVTVLVDGVQVSGLDFINQDLFDLQNIQVVRGPQGAVYGRGAIGGAILINTLKPADEFEGGVEAAYTSEIDEYRATGSVSGPIVKDVARFRLAASHADREGFIDNSLAGGQCDFVEETIFRGRLLLQPSENLSIDAKANYLDGFTYATCLNFSTDADPFLGDGENWPSDLPRDFKQFDDREIQEYSLKIDYETPLGTLTSATGYQLSESFSPGDVDFGPVIQPVFFENPVDVDSWNTDLHFVSKPVNNLRWILGGFFQDRTTENFLVVGIGPPPIQPPFFFNSVQEDISKASAVYGELTYEPSDKAELSVALRYDEDKRESQDVTVPGSFIEETFTELQPRASFAYRWNEDLMTYVTIGRGFRSGGFNSLADIQAVGLTDRRFDEETATTYEAGLKGTFMDGLLNVNAALFRTDFDNQQFFFVDTVNIARVVITFPETRINGAELELNLRPMQGLDLNASLGIADGEVQEGGTFAPDDVASPNSHEYTFNLTGQHLTSLTRRIDLRTRLDYERRGPIYYDRQNRFRYHETDFLNAFLAFEWGNYTVALFGRNITDERIPTTFFTDGGGPGIHQFFQNLPRRYGLQFRARF